MAKPLRRTAVKRVIILPALAPKLQPMLENMLPAVDKPHSTTASRYRAPRTRTETADREVKADAAIGVSRDASLERARTTNAVAAVLAEWYQAHSVVRRAWAIDAIDAIRIVVVLEPTVDGGDTQPAWLAHSWNWAQELRARMGQMVHLEMIDDSMHIESSLDGTSTLVAEAFWRDPSASSE